MRKKNVKKTVAKVIASGCSMAFILGAMPAVNAQSSATSSYVAVSMKDEQNQQATIAAIRVMEAARKGMDENLATQEALKNE